MMIDDLDNGLDADLDDLDDIKSNTMDFDCSILRLCL